MAAYSTEIEQPNQATAFNIKYIYEGAREREERERKKA
jgi:hypothetical protein